ncbi:conserved hypothetical protein [Candidatus Nitrotoga sp. HW29]|uniref:hypothetical protein n=1 Tax=Candidatus Nitrotoga sp. HW29 TaxID=2886963 RepID=UPI001EF31FEC|nr:hypothetical protein [Candidatus Nitrotoga sp. HW29]CAH1903505.1 conserved hypothetical protein [Candidatus Nitrotoga sp. HW29]
MGLDAQTLSFNPNLSPIQMREIIKKLFKRLIEIFVTVSGFIIAKMRNPQQRYWAALRWVKWLLPVAVFVDRWVFRRYQKSPLDTTALLKFILSAITRYAYIEIPLRSPNEQTLLEYHRKYGGFILCSAHFGLTMAVFGFLEKHGLPVMSISNGGSGKKAYGWNWGCTAPLRLIKPDEKSLIKVRKALAKNEIVLVYCDHAPDDNFQNDFLYLSPNIFEYAYKTTTPLLFLGAALAYDGMIEIEFVEASHPIPASEEELVVVMEEFRCFVAQRMKKSISFKKKLPLLV